MALGSVPPKVSQAQTALREMLGALVAAFLALCGFWLISGFRPGDLGGLWGRSDVIFEYAISKALREMQVGFLNPSLGFPAGQDWSHFPVLDLANRLELHFLSIFLDPVTSVNVLYLVSFPLVAAFMYGVLRNLLVSRLIAIAGGVSFTLVGYHFDYEHPFLGNYWAIPVGIFWLTLLSNSDSFASRRLSVRQLLVLGIMAGLAVGSHNPQYAVFLSLLGGAALVLATLTGRRGLPVRYRLLLTAIPGFVLLAIIAISRWMREVPAVTPSADRPVLDSFIWGGQFTSLLAVPGESVLSNLWFNEQLLEAQDTSIWTGVSTLQSAPVVAATLVTIGLALTLVFSSVGLRTQWQRVIDPARPWAALWLVGVAFFIMSGMGAVFAALVYPQVRGWMRFAIVLVALAITVTAVTVTRLVAEWNRNPSTRNRVLLVVVVGFGSVVFIDQFTARYPLEADTTTLGELQDLSDIGSSVVPSDCTVFNLPIMDFPEAVPPGSMQAYDHLLPYIADAPWKFSYGAVRGQLGSRWTDHLAVQPAPQAKQLAAQGFCAVLIDSAGLDETGPSFDQFLDAYGPPAASAMNRWFLFALPSTDPVAQQDSLFSRPEVDYGSDFSVERLRGDGLVGRWTQKERSTLRVWNPGFEPALLLAETSLTAADCPNPQQVFISTSSGYSSDARVEPGATVKSFIPLEAPARSNVDVSWVTPSATCLQEGETGPVGVQITDLRFTLAQPDGLAISNYSGFYEQETNEAGQTWRWINGTLGTFDLFNVDYESAEARLTGILEAAPCAASQAVSIEIGSQFIETKVLQQGVPLNVDFPVTLSGFGHMPVVIRALSPACESDGGTRLLGPRVQDLELTRAG